MDRSRKKYLKKLVRQNERTSFLRLMPITPEQAQSLFDYLDETLGEAPCDHSLCKTAAWCTANAIALDTVAGWTREHSGNCDCEVLADVEETFQDATRASREGSE